MTETPPARRRRWPFVLLGLAVVPAIVGGAFLGFGLQFDLPDVRKLQDYTPPVSTRVLARDGSPLASFAEQRRTLIGYRDIPKVFEQALISVEDSNFYRHSGIDVRGILRAVWHDVTTMSLQQGASTITQQLARNLFPAVVNPADKTLRRKVQEALLALEIERLYSKQEILQLYCNQVYMGHGRYGLEAASHFYFGKPAKELNLPEAALLAGIVQRPEALSPVRRPDRAIKRRNHVLDRMVEEGYITASVAKAAQSSPLQVTSWHDADLAPYFVEEVRRHLQAKYGDEALYQSGLQVRTTLDPRLQAIANRAMDLGLRELDKRQGWRGVKARVPAGQAPESYEPPSWRAGLRSGDVTDGVVLSVADGRARVRVGPWIADLLPKDVEWTRRSSVASIARRGDVVRVRLKDGDRPGEMRISLEQEPKVEAALIAIDPATGAVLALNGGFDFERSEFDRAIQAKRQCGSAFKPFVYAAALSHGKTLSDTLLDEPTVFVDPTTFVPYEPENYGGTYYATLTLRHALEKSANIATVKLINRVGFDPVIEMARNLGIGSDLRPYPSLALGAFEVSLLEITSAYGSFANQGVRVEPHLVDEVLSAKGDSLERARPEVRDAVSPQIAYLMTRLMEGVVTDGTGAAARELGRPLAGKTGTTDDFTDAWFVGYAPDLVVGVWVGFDEKKSLGARETGAQAALPIWMRFMGDAYGGRPPEDFPIPSGISVVAIDALSGLRASESAGCNPVLPEVFLQGTEPTAYCSAAEHARLRLPYPFQRYHLDEEGALIVPPGDLEKLLASERSVRLEAGGTRLEADTAEGKVSVELRRGSDTGGTALPEEVLRRVDPSQWIGKDGRPAQAEMIRS